MTRLPMIVATLTLAALVAACGADGAPERPQAGVSISGTAEFGIVGSSR